MLSRVVIGIWWGESDDGVELLPDEFKIGLCVRRYLSRATF